MAFRVFAFFPSPFAILSCWSFTSVRIVSRSFSKHSATFGSKKTGSATVTLAQYPETIWARPENHPPTSSTFLPKNALFLSLGEENPIFERTASALTWGETLMDSRIFRSFEASSGKDSFSASGATVAATLSATRFFASSAAASRAFRARNSSASKRLSGIQVGSHLLVRSSVMFPIISEMAKRPSRAFSKSYFLRNFVFTNPVPDGVRISLHSPTSSRTNPASPS